MIASFVSLLSIDIQKCEQIDENSNSKTNLMQTVLSYVEKHTYLMHASDLRIAKTINLSLCPDASKSSCRYM